MIDLLDKLQAVLDDAHAGHVYVSDKERHGLREHWDIDLVGDCDSFALWCRQELRSRYDIEADLIFCYVPDEGGHLVASVEGWVLDNRHKRVMRRDDLDYRWIAMGRAGKWYRLEDNVNG